MKKLHIKAYTLFTIFVTILSFNACENQADFFENTTLTDYYNTLLQAPPNLPAMPYNYANINLPPYYNAPPIQGQNNTPNNNQITNAGATLGRVLFYDKNMSYNNTIACASCHKQEDGFSDTDVFSQGFLGGLTGRNSMGLTNARFYQNGSFFWDERAETLEDQVLLPIQDHVEMGMSLDTLVLKLDIPYYDPLFEDAFGDTTITADRISLALSQFIRSMVSYNAKFDEGMQAIGQAPFETTPFPNYTESENLGKQLYFSNQTNCATCHGAVSFAAPGPRNNGLDLVYTDNGIGDITGNPQDNALFKVNSLRNIELTPPYMHDGRFETLEEVIEHYNSGVQNHPNLSPTLRGGGGQPRVLNLTQQEKTALVDFLKTLTDNVFTEDIKYSNPFTE